MSAGLRATGLRRVVGGRALFEDLDLHLPPGTTLVVRGASGAGKTQLLRALAGLDPLDEGAVSLDGATPEALGWTGWRRRVRLVAQDPPVFSGTPAELWVRICGFAALADAVDDPRPLALRLGLDDDALNRPWSALSGGERQRISLAFALASRPDVLLLDEPTSALDEEAMRAAEGLLRERTCVWVTHDPAQAERVADATLWLGDAP